jgi:RNA polymerase sigma factor (sigma-70 family)
MEKIIALPMAQRQESILYAVRKYGKRLFGFIRSRVKNDEDAEDILQDVWYQLSSIIDTEPIGQLSSWLYRVSRNRIIDNKRKKSSLSLEDLAFEDEDGELTFPEALIIDNINPESEFERAYFWESFFKALNELPEKQKQVFVLNELEDLTLQEIAEITGENIKTVISRKRYAVAKLRELLNNLKKDY